VAHTPQKFYLDVGVSRGDTIEQFFNHNQLPDGRQSFNPYVVFSEPYNPADFNVFGWEAHPRHSAGAKRLMATYPKLKIYTETAVWINTDGITLHGVDWRNDGVEQGASAFTSHKDIKPGATQYKVPSVDFSEWMRSNVQKSDLVWLKMNIEGAEYEVLRKMTVDGTICLVDRLYIFYHDYVVTAGSSAPCYDTLKWLWTNPSCGVEIVLERIDS
jgi:FkbM family methyltransferase